jgi:menaquinone-dependent protoporphyrinogen oxidase
MPRSILVAYASKHGSTQETAEAIAGMLRDEGLWAHTRRAAEIDDLWGYDGVVLAGSIYAGRWHTDARDFLKRHRQELAEVPVAIFAMGPKTSSEHDLGEARKQLDLNLKKLPDVRPVTIAIFGGVVDPAKLHFPFNKLPATDARDWDAIRSWSKEVAEAMLRTGKRTRVPV